MKSDFSKKLAAIGELSQLMQEKRPFSYIRLGDGELSWLLEVQETGKPPQPNNYKHQKGARISSTHGVRGVNMSQYKRLLRAYENSSFVDLQQAYPYNEMNLSKLRISHSIHSFQTSPGTSKLKYDWVYHEFSKYISNRKCLFVAAEGPLLGHLYRDPIYRKIAGEFWPDNALPYFIRVREDGRYYWNHLDDIKQDIREKVLQENIDTVFLSLGTGAKVLCYELAEELGICTFALGAAVRALTYAGSPGYHAARGTHTPFLFRLPLSVYMKALQKAYPDMSLPDLVSKAHAQLCLDLQKKRVAKSSATDIQDSDNFEPTPENLRHFWINYHFYQEMFASASRKNRRIRELMTEFEVYRRSRLIGVDSYVYKPIYSCLNSIKKLANALNKV